MLKSKNKFFNFEKPIYDDAGKKVVIKNLQEERTKLDKFITSTWDKISDNESLDKKCAMFSEFEMNLKRFDKELATVKKEIKIQYINDVDKTLSEMQNDCKETSKEIREEIIACAIKENRNDLIQEFLIPSTLELRAKTNNIEQLKALQVFCQKIGITYSLYKDGKVLKNEQYAKTKSNEMEAVRN